METICNKCGAIFRQIWRPEYEAYTSFKECHECRMDNATWDFNVSDKQNEAITEILEFVGRHGFSIKEVREVLSLVIHDFERNIKETVINNTKRSK